LEDSRKRNIENSTILVAKSLIIWLEDSRKRNIENSTILVAKSLIIWLEDSRKIKLKITLHWVLEGHPYLDCKFMASNGYGTKKVINNIILGGF
jgi:hypothetical protein